MKNDKTTKGTDMKTRRMKKSSQRAARLFLAVVGVGVWTVLSTGQALGQSDDFEITQPTPGGINPRPQISSVTASNNQLLLKWFGFQGPYQIQRATNVSGGPWQNVGTAIDGNSAAIGTIPGNAFHRISGGAVSYQGDSVCYDCHNSYHSEWSETAHARAYDTLKKINQHTNTTCLVCHVAGFGVQGGFANEATTPELVNVQCENCHGPAGNHVSSGDPPTIFPVTTKSPMLCGGCHNGFHHPTYDEWTSSPHHAVVEELAEEFVNPTNRTAEITRMNSCGACHSGAVRLAMLGAYNSSTAFNARTNVAWPTGHEAATTPVSCQVCHETHRVRKYTNVLTGVVYTNQLRNPLQSTNVFSYNTGTNFAANYNPNVSLCGQCHNARGATVGSSGRPPHYSPQYNIFLGIIGVTTNSTPPQGAHKTNPLQCAGCHTHGHNAEGATPGNPAYTGHAFRATIEACSACHTDTTGVRSPTNLLFTTQAEISARITTVKNLLDLWATTKNTNSWATRYDARGWEYTTPGELSNPSGSTSIVGPTSAEQAQIPQGIKDARFNLYLLSRDKSQGIHNAPYARYLLDVAQQRVNAELAK